MTHIADLKTFDVADYLDSEEKIAEYLTVVLEDNRLGRRGPRPRYDATGT